MDNKTINGLIIGERYTWYEIEKAFPNMWVVVKDYELARDGGVANGVLVDVLDSDSLNKFDNYANKGCICQWASNICETGFDVGGVFITEALLRELSRKL